MIDNNIDHEENYNLEENQQSYKKMETSYFR